MYKLNEDLSIYVTRGDIVLTSVKASFDGKPYTFMPGDLVRFKVFKKKNASVVVLEKDFPVTTATQSVQIYLSKEDTKIGNTISKPVDYWYEVELNPLSDPQTIIGYDEDGAKVFKLFPEGADKEVEEHIPDDEEILSRYMDDELDLSSKHPVENHVIARAFARMEGMISDIHDAVVTPQTFGAVGDGAADDTEALKKAFAYAAENKVKCFIPKGIYNVSPTTSKEYEDGNTYTYCFDVPSGLNIEGANRDETVIKVVTDKTRYTSVFCSYDVNDHCKNITIKNITIEQDYESASDDIASLGRNNPKCVIALWSPSENVNMENIYFKNCCGMNPVLINNAETTNVLLASCKFDFKVVRNIGGYDRSVVYMECANYLVENNEVNGNFETFGGIELHGYNGTCRNNLVKNCVTAIHIAPRFYSPVESASILVDGNRVRDCFYGIKLWENTAESATKGFEGVTIRDNDIDVNCAIVEEQIIGVGETLTLKSMRGICSETYMETVYKNVKIIGNSIVYHNALLYSTTMSDLSYGIGIVCPSDVDGLIIARNYIEGCFGSGIALGGNSDQDGTRVALKNIEVSENIIKNCGRNADKNAVNCAYILLRHSDKENVIFKHNILEKTDDHTVYASFYNLSTANSTHKNVYFGKDNIIKTNNPAHMLITNYNQLSNIMYDEGATALRPTIANKGFTFYDSTIGKMIMWNGSAWVNLDGTALA